MLDSVNPAVFECKKCGHCCSGEGGIILSSGDIKRLASFLGLSDEEALANWATLSNGKYKIKSGEDGRCVFFIHKIGCSIHPAKPDVCRAWPFFRGNLEDSVSLDLARDYCPGISRHCSFNDFIREGLRYLDETGILARETNASALQIAHIAQAFNLPGRK